MFEDGQLTDGLGNTVDFKNTIIIMTSNLGARFLEKRSPMGFSAPAGEARPTKVEDQVMSEVKKAFNPEFLNRLDEVILFTSLTDEDLLKIMDLLADQINENLVAKQIKIRLDSRRRQVHPREDLHGSQLRRASAAPRAAEVHRGSAQRSADSGLAAAARRARSLPRRHRHLLSRAQRRRRCSRHRRRCTRRTGPGHSALHVLNLFLFPKRADRASGPPFLLWITSSQVDLPRQREVAIDSPLPSRDNYPASMSSPQVFGPYLTLVLFLLAAFVAVGREFWIAPGLEKAYPLGRVSLAVPLAVFGMEHLTSPGAIMRLVPPWMPGKLFWTYFIGVALIAAALSFIFRVRIRLAATLLGIMFFCFVAMMDLPAAIAAPHNRIPWTLAARESAFSAGAILLAITSSPRQRTPGENRLAIGALYLLALVSIFYGIEHLLHPERVPVVPLGQSDASLDSLRPLLDAPDAESPSSSAEPRCL